MKVLMRWLASPANWCGLGLASVVLGLKGAGLLGTLGLGMAVVGYGAGFVVGGLWFGFPSNREPAWEVLEFSDEGDTREAMERAVPAPRRKAATLDFARRAARRLLGHLDPKCELLG